MTTIDVTRPDFDQAWRARMRAFGATGWRTAPTQVDYTQFTDAELRQARDETLARLNTDEATEDDATRADQISTEIERRNTITEATNERRRRLAEVRVTERWRPDVTNPAAPQPGDRGQRPPDDTGNRQVETIPADWRQRMATGAAAWRERGMAGTAEILSLPNATDLRTLVTTATFPAQPTRLPGITYPPIQVLRIADLVDNQTATSGVVEWVIEATNSLAPVEVAEGAAKPEGALTFTVASAALATIAVWIPITRQAAEDDAQLTGYLQGRMNYACEKRLDGQIVNGNGTAPNMRGILNTVGIQTQAVATDGMLIAVRKAITKAQVAGYDPDGIVMHPVDWEGVELTRDTVSGQFLMTKDPSSLAAPRLWGLPVVPTVTIAAGTSLVGAFKEGATLWRKPGIRVLMSDSHDVNFTKNILVILSELRAQLAVYAPPAFIKVS